MKITKILKNIAIGAVVAAGVLAFASCDLLDFINVPETPEHTHSLEFVSGMDATCTEKGYEDYYQCECGKLFADAEGTTEIDKIVEIGKTGHVETVIPAKPSTCTQDGTTEGKKCSSCGKILLAPEAVPHYGILVNGEHCCEDNCSVEGLALAKDSDGVYTMTCDNAVISSISFENFTLNILGTLTITPEDGTAISVNNGTLNFLGATANVNGNVLTANSFVKLDNNAVVTVTGGHVYTKGENVEDAEQEFGFKHRLFVRQGTLNINHNNDGNAVLWSNSIQVGSERDNVKGYININSGTDSGMRIEDDLITHWMFANGELNFVGENGDNSAAIRLGGNKAKHIDFLNGMTVNVKNYKIAFLAEWLYVYVAFNSKTFNLENVETAITANKRCRIYAQEIVQVEYTDENGKTALANVRLSGNVIVGNVYAGEAYADFSFVDFPTVEDYESWVANAEAKVDFISWVE